MPLVVAIWLCTSFYYFGWVEVKLNKIKAKHSTKKLYEFIGGQGIHICTKLDQNFAVLEFCYTF